MSFKVLIFVTLHQPAIAGFLGVKMFNLNLELEMKQIINCTPHAITIGTTTFEPSGAIPRVSTKQEKAPEIAGFPCVTSTTGKIEGLPEMDIFDIAPTFCDCCGGNGCPECANINDLDRIGEIQTYLIVSGMVFSASDRKDLIAPDTGKTAIRDEKGHIVAVTRFLRK